MNDQIIATILWKLRLEASVILASGQQLPLDIVADIECAYQALRGCPDRLQHWEPVYA